MRAACKCTVLYSMIDLLKGICKYWQRIMLCEIHIPCNFSRGESLNISQIKISVADEFWDMRQPCVIQPYIVGTDDEDEDKNT